MNRFEFILWRIAEKFCEHYNIFKIVSTKEGLKTINTKLILQDVRPLSEETVMIPSSKLYLGIDYLNDANTLLGCMISQSPHVDFIRTILNGDELNNTEYIQRFQSGKLDGRRGRTRIKDFSLFKTRCANRCSQVENDNPQTVLIYKVGDKNYIYDGKHRAALCCIKGIDVKCQYVDFNFRDNALFKVMAKSKDFNKHLSLLK